MTLVFLSIHTAAVEECRMALLNLAVCWSAGRWNILESAIIPKAAELHAG